MSAPGVITHMGDKAKIEATGDSTNLGLTAKSSNATGVFPLPR